MDVPSYVDKSTTRLPTYKIEALYIFPRYAEKYNFVKEGMRHALEGAGLEQPEISHVCQWASKCPIPCTVLVATAR